MKIEMKDRIDTELQGKQPQQIKELLLDNCVATSITGLSDEFESLETFRLTDAGLTTLKGFPKLISLRKVELGSNCLNGGLENLVVCENIEFLDLKGNKIQCLEQLEPLTQLSNLKSLELLNCEIASIENYREQIFKLLPNIKYLDGLDRDGLESEEIVENLIENAGEQVDEEDTETEGEEADESHEVGLSYLAKEDLAEDEEDDEDFDAEKVDATNNSTADEEEDDIDEEEIKAISEGVEIDNENSNSRSGLKRKLDESE